VQGVKTLYSGSLSFFLFLCGIDRNGESLWCCTTVRIPLIRSCKSALFLQLNSVFVFVSLKMSKSNDGSVIRRHRRFFFGGSGGKNVVESSLSLVVDVTVTMQCTCILLVAKLNCALLVYISVQALLSLWKTGRFLCGKKKKWCVTRFSVPLTTSWSFLLNRTTPHLLA
jgi:hypothetical protein